MAHWGIDLGGTKIEGVVLAERNADSVLLRTRIPTEAAKGYRHILAQIQRLVEIMASEVGMRPDHIGIGTPGTTDPTTGLLKNSNTTCLNGQPLKTDLEALLGIPLRMANDANCFAVAETTLGAVQTQVPDARVVFGVIMGTGVGGGLVIDGQAWNGRHGIGGEWGHIFLDESGGPCYCGKVGCAERIISGTALERYYREQGGASRRLKEILQRHHAGTDPLATATIERLLDHFAKGISYILNVIDPDVVVLGGGLANIDLLYTEGVARIPAHLFNPRLETPFLRPALGDSAGVFGAAML